MREVFPLQAHRKRKKRSFIELRDGFASLIRRKVRIAEGHTDRAMTQKITHSVQRNALLDQTRSKVMAQIVPAKMPDARSLEDFFPRRLKSGGDTKDICSNA